MPFEPISKFLPKSTHPQKNGQKLKKTIVDENFYKMVCGIDEVGRGPWAGPLVTAALILTKNIKIPSNKDSKKLTEKQREKIFEKLQSCAVYGVGKAEVEEIAELGLTQATHLAFRRAIEKLSETVKPDCLLIDGKAKWDLPHPSVSIIKGDERVKIIACASIIAKVTRDRLMKEYAKKYPQYGFEEHKGYGTASHQLALKKHGPCEIHRKSFAPIAEYFKV